MRPPARSTTGTTRVVKGSSTVAPPARAHLDEVAGAEIVDRDHRAERLAGAVHAASPIRSA